MTWGLGLDAAHLQTMQLHITAQIILHPLMMWKRQERERLSLRLVQRATVSDVRSILTIWSVHGFQAVGLDGVYQTIVLNATFYCRLTIVLAHPKISLKGKSVLEQANGFPFLSEAISSPKSRCCTLWTQCCCTLCSSSVATVAVVILGLAWLEQLWTKQSIHAIPLSTYCSRRSGRVKVPGHR